jgi:hypothetical protein
MKNGFILVMLLMAVLFSLFAIEPQKIDTGQPVKSQTDIVFNAFIGVEKSIVYATSFKVMEFRELSDANYNYNMANPINSLSAYESPTLPVLSPKEDYGVVKSFNKC